MPQLPDIHTWDEDSLKSLPGGETSYIDYKDSRWLTFDEDWRQKISTYLSAFANYDGGYLIIGVSDPDKTGAASPDGGVDNSIRGGIVQWLQNVLPGLVERPLDRIDIWPIGPKNAESAIRLGHSVLAIHVAPSEGAPHQARDGKYYGRHGSRRHFLGHRAIMDILSRRKHPTVRVQHLHLTWTQLDEFILTAVVENTSTILARFCSVIVELPVLIGQNAILTNNGNLTTADDGLEVVRVNLNNGFGAPLFPLSKKILRAKLEGLPRPNREFRTIQNVRFKAFADEMPFIEGALPFEEVLVKH